MSLELVERIAKAVLYEGYILYPYRPSSVKNQRRFNFGVLVPPDYGALQSGNESSVMRTECLVCGGPGTSVDITVRFLQVIPGTWQNAIERRVNLHGCSVEQVMANPRREEFHFSAEAESGGEGSVDGAITVTARLIEEGIYQLTVEVANLTPVAEPQSLSRDQILPYSLAAAHTILAVHDGEFVSLLDPPGHLQPYIASCQNLGTWPVLVGEAGQRVFLLSSPIILYDYPQIAPESPGDLFDGLEIDEILTLRIMTLTDEEKMEVRNGDERARRILERTEMMPEEQFAKLHGALRGMRLTEEK